MIRTFQAMMTALAVDGLRIPPSALSFSGRYTRDAEGNILFDHPGTSFSFEVNGVTRVKVLLSQIFDASENFPAFCHYFDPGILSPSASAKTSFPNYFEVAFDLFLYYI